MVNLSQGRFSVILTDHSGSDVPAAFVAYAGRLNCPLASEQMLIVKHAHRKCLTASDTD